MDKIAGRDCRDCTGCRPEIPRLQGLLGLPNFQSETAESPDRDCWGCNGDCRPTLQRLQRLLGVARMQIFPGLSRLSRLSPENAGIANFAGREMAIACWDWKIWRCCRTGLMGLQRLPINVAQIGRVAGTDENAEFADRDCQDSERECLPRSPDNIVKAAEIAKSVSQDCRCYRYCRPRVGDCKLRLKKLTRLPDGFAWTAETADKKCRDWRGCWECRIFSPRCSKPWPRLLRLRRRLTADIAETAEIILSANNADISKIVEIAETFAQDCRDNR